MPTSHDLIRYARRYNALKAARRYGGWAHKRTWIAQGRHPDMWYRSYMRETKRRGFGGNYGPRPQPAVPRLYYGAEWGRPFFNFKRKKWVFGW
jgi:hypothetical protein